VVGPAPDTRPPEGQQKNRSRAKAHPRSAIATISSAFDPAAASRGYLGPREPARNGALGGLAARSHTQFVRQAVSTDIVRGGAFRARELAARHVARRRTRSIALLVGGLVLVVGGFAGFGVYQDRADSIRRNGGSESVAIVYDPANPHRAVL